MLALLCGTIWAGVVIYLLSLVMRQFRAHRATAIDALVEGSSSPSVSIIVPVRNEIDNVAHCLDALIVQVGLAPRSEIIVVDDGSDDGTVTVVEHYTSLRRRGRRVRLAAAGPLPDGWVGKPHACRRGALLAEGDWLCFVDADVRAAPELVATAIDAAEAHGIDMLSLHPFQELGSFWERLVIPAGYLMIACAKELRATGNPLCCAADANGQFMLIRRGAYFAVGGHAAVGAEICEDKALALRVQQAGFHFQVRAAEHLARTRMYRDFNSLWEGLSKNATEILDSASATLTAALTGSIVGWIALTLPAAIGARLLYRPTAAVCIGFALSLAGSAVVIGIQVGTARHFRVAAVFGPLFACGYTLAAVIACHSALLRYRGRVRWRGRTYDLRRKASPGRS
jgi:chlorobactene glucosyltransferase